MKKPVLAVIVILVALTAACVTMYRPNTVSTDNAYIQTDVTSISPEVGGKVNRILVGDNQWVSAGDALFSIDDKDYVANQQIAISTLEVANAALSANKTKTEMQRVKIDQAKQVINSAQANADHQHAELARYKSLLKKQSISHNLYEGQKVKSIEAESNLASAILGLSAEQKQYDTLLTEKLQLLAQQKQAQASLNLANIAQQRTIITAPFDGYVTNRQVQVGKYVQPGMGLMTMVPDYIWVEANFKETQLEYVQIGQQVDVRLDMFPDHSLAGRVVSITPATGAQFSLLPAQNATGNFVKVVQRVPVRIQLQIPDDLKQRVYPGLSAEVAIHTVKQG
ncbi:MAG: HlyD family secretion protein [Psychromonas sp.]